MGGIALRNRRGLYDYLDYRCIFSPRFSLMANVTSGTSSFIRESEMEKHTQLGECSLVYNHLHTFVTMRGGGNGVLRRFQQPRSYRDEIETQNQLVSRSLSVAKEP